MTLRTLSPEELTQLYHREMVEAFPPSELKPLSSMLDMMDRGCYDALALGSDAQAYAMMWREPAGRYVLLDYLGTSAKLRSRGLGSQMLAALAGRYPEGIFAESEAPESGDPREEELRRRRLGFYARNGFIRLDYDCALFGVHYQVLLQGGTRADSHRVMETHQAIYQAYMPPHIYRKYIQIPLGPGEQPFPPQRWTEE